MASNVPVVTVNNENLGAYQVISAASFIHTVSSGVTYFDLGDIGGDGGYFVLDGTIMADGQWITVSAAALADGDLLYVSGPGAGSENIEVAAWNGLSWSSVAVAKVTTTASNLPQIQVQDRAMFAGYQIYASSFIASASDPTGKPISYFQFWDQGGDGGHFALNGVAQADGKWIVVPTADLAELTYVGGSTPGRETIDIEAWNGVAWSYYKSATATTLAVEPPIVTIQDQSVAEGKQVAASGFVNTVSDPYNFAITYYDFKDVGGDGGYFSLNGVKQADGAWITVSAAQLSHLVYVGAAAAGSESVEVAAFDGYFWSSYGTAAAITTASQYANPPTLTVKNASVVELQSLPISKLIGAVSAPAGKAITAYAFETVGSSGGTLQLAGTPEAANTWITVSASQLSSLIYVAGSSAAAEKVNVAAYDGSAWSATETAVVTTTAPVVPRPVVKTAPATVTVGGSIQASSFMSSVTAPANDAITEYDFRDQGADGGYFSFNGVKQADGAWITVSAAQLAQLTYVGAPKAGSEIVDVAAFDGQVWSLYATATATTAASTAPTIKVQNETVAANGSLLASKFIVSTSDPTKLPITEYEFEDVGGDGGHLSLNGVAKADGVFFVVTAAQLASLTYVAGASNGSETIDIKAGDGHSWSNYASAVVTTTGGKTLNPIIAKLTTPGVKADVTALLQNNSLSYAAMLKILQDAAAAGDSTAKFADLKTLVASFNKTGGVSVSSYVAYISNALVNGDGANANWTGGAATSVALGNLTATTNTTNFARLIDKWFLGTDLPSMTFDNTIPSKYVAVNDPLYNSTGLPAVADINQGDIGDCYLLSSLAEIAEDQALALKAMITVDGNNTYGVEFYIGGKPVYVTVNNELPESTQTGGFCANTSSDLWSSLIEKAYVQLNDDPGYLDHTTGNAYNLIDDGTADPITQLTGRSVTSYSYSNYSIANWANLKTTIEDAILNHDEVDFASFGATTLNGKTAFVKAHMFSGIGYDSTTGEFIVRNPWGVEPAQTWNTEFEATMSDFYGVAGTFFVANGSTGSTPPQTAAVVSMTNFLADQPEIDAAAAGVDVRDSVATIETHLGALSTDPNVMGIVGTGGAITVDVQQVVACQSALLKIAGGFEVEDTVVNVEADMSQLAADATHITAVNFVDGGTPTLSVSASVAKADAALLAKIASPYVLDVSVAGGTQTQGHGDDLTIGDVAGADVISGGGAHETFVFRDSFGKAAITDAHADWANAATHDTLQFLGGEFSNFVSFLNDASVKNGAIEVNHDGDSLVLDGFSSRQQLIAGNALGDFKFG